MLGSDPARASRPHHIPGSPGSSTQHMTLAEARYVIANRHYYSNATYHYALDIVEAAERGR